MMSNVDLTEFEPGCVRRWTRNNASIRILVHSDGMVQYDAWRADLNAWGMRDIQALQRKNVYYYTIRAELLDARSKFAERDPLNPEEAGIHRPDLPFTAARSKTQSWHSVDTVRIEDPRTLPVAEIFFQPFTASGDAGPMVRVRAEDGASFTSGELVQRGQELLKDVPESGLVVNGVGIHRLGLRQGIPSYYLWGAEWQGAQPG
jgi:hypothetical protein